MSDLGKRILATVNEIAALGVEVKQIQAQDVSEYVFGNDQYEISLRVNPKKWIGLEFRLIGARIIYPINTDLYDITSSNEKDFAEIIESDIVCFLQELKEGRIKIANNGKKQKVLVRVGDEYVFLKAGRFFSSSKIYKNKAIAEKQLGNDYQILEMK